MNNVTLVGRLTKEPELRATTSGVSVCTFILAVDRRFKQNGQPQADFLNIVAWKGTADNCAKYLHKGSQAAVSGSIQTRSYDATDGSKRYVTEIIADEVQFLSTKNENGSNVAQNGLNSNEYEAVTEDEVPF